MDEVSAAFGTEPAQVIGAGSWRSRFAVTELACLSMGAVGSAVANLISALNLGAKPEVQIDRRLASLWFTWSIHPQGWDLPPSWDAIAGDYEASNGWIKLHTNAPHHRAAALSILDCKADREAVAQAVADWDSDALETAIVDAGGAAAAMRNRAAWSAHPQGGAVASEPLVHWHNRSGRLRQWHPTTERPLKGLRVLDLTRVLAGPVGTRTLAGYGAEVLRIDPANWHEPGVVPDVTLGKRCGHLDLKSEQDKAVFRELLENAHVLVHGYRPGALDAMIGSDRPNHIAEVCLDAYGWTGPWAERRGFDSLVQMSCGIAAEGAAWADTLKPHPLPVQALDHATGYFVAAAVISALTKSIEGEEVHRARLSLARTAELLFSLEPENQLEIKESHPSDLDAWVESTIWGPARRLKSAIQVQNVPMKWETPAVDLRSTLPVWE